MISVLDFMYLAILAALWCATMLTPAMEAIASAKAHGLKLPNLS
jgi:hypothetical protein